MIKDRNIYITYTDDITALYAEFDGFEKVSHLHDGSHNFIDKMCFKLDKYQSGTHGVCVVSCVKQYYDNVLKPLEQSGLLEFLGCEHDGCDNGCEEDWQSMLSVEDKAKMALADTSNELGI